LPFSAVRKGHVSTARKYRNCVRISLLSALSTQVHTPRHAFRSSEGVETRSIRHHSEDTKLGTKTCPICGKEAATGNRYCSDCDYDGSGATADPGQRKKTAPAQRRGSSVPLVLLFFVMSAFGTVLAGIFAPNALSIPLMRSGSAEVATDWGEVRVARVMARVRAQASTRADVVDNLAIGDSVRVEPVPNGWYRVYAAELVPRLRAKPLGFVYGTLLVEPGPNVVFEAQGESGRAEDPARESTQKKRSGRGGR